MDKHYFLDRYEIDCLERTIEELIQLYPHVSIAQIEADMAEIQGNCPEMGNLDWFSHIDRLWFSLMVYFFLMVGKSHF